MIKLSVIMFCIASYGESDYTSAPNIFCFQFQETKSHADSHVPLGKKTKQNWVDLDKVPSAGPTSHG